MKKPRIETKPKEVEFARLKDGSFPTKAGIDFDTFADNIADIREHIISGKKLPDHYYRKSSGKDHLLHDEGWVHLHVGHNIDDNILLIVQQTDEKVIFISLTDHDIFRERPRGKSLHGLRGKVAKLALPSLKPTITKKK